MIAQTRATASKQQFAAAGHSLDRELKPYRGKMNADQIAMLERQLFERRRFEVAGCHASACSASERAMSVPDIASINRNIPIADAA